MEEDREKREDPLAKAAEIYRKRVAEATMKHVDEDNPERTEIRKVLKLPIEKADQPNKLEKKEEEKAS